MAANLIVSLMFTLLLIAFYRALASRAFWKKKVMDNEGVTLVCYFLPNGKEENYHEVSVKHFPGKQRRALEDAHGFLERDGYKQINTACRAQVFSKFARGNERIKIFFLSDGIVSETML